MSISIWDLFKFLFKWKITIIVVTIMSFALSKFYVDKHQTYSSRVIIQYDDKCISNGKTLDGEPFDSNEIKSPKVILNVLRDLGYENRKVESVRENISISPITPKTVDNLKAAKEKLGEEYNFYPKTFSITYKGNASFEATRDILSSIVANYFKFYSEKYLYLATLNEVDYNINKKNFDYLEQIEQINENLKQTTNSLSSYARDSSGYRSPSTGLTFTDLLHDFERVQEFAIPKIYAKIYEGQVSQNRELLISKYMERAEACEREMQIFNYRAALTYDRMETYVNAHKKSGTPSEDGNDEGESTELLQDVEHDRENNVDEQTTYDMLITAYANDSVAANNQKIDAEYSRYVIEKFSSERNPYINYDEYETDVKESIAGVLEELSEMYQKANMNISDYNSFIPALHIKKLSGVNYYGNIRGTVYEFVAIIGGFSLSCMAAIAYEIMRKYALYNKKDDEAEKAEGASEAEEDSKE